jgi:hypothetical protein
MFPKGLCIEGLVPNATGFRGGASGKYGIVRVLTSSMDLSINGFKI